MFSSFLSFSFLYIGTWDLSHCARNAHRSENSLECTSIGLYATIIRTFTARQSSTDDLHRNSTFEQIYNCNGTPAGGFRFFVVVVVAARFAEIYKMNGQLAKWIRYKCYQCACVSVLNGIKDIYIYFTRRSM